MRVHLLQLMMADLQRGVLHAGVLQLQARQLVRGRLVQADGGDRVVVLLGAGRGEHAHELVVVEPAVAEAVEALDQPRLRRKVPRSPIQISIQPSIQ